MSDRNDEQLLWDFKCTATRTSDGLYHVEITDGLSGESRMAIGFHPLCELIRLLGDAKMSKTT